MDALNLIFPPNKHLPFNINSGVNRILERAVCPKGNFRVVNLYKETHRLVEVKIEDVMMPEHQVSVSHFCEILIKKSKKVSLFYL